MKLLTLLLTGALGVCALSAAPAVSEKEMTRPQAIAKLQEMRIEKKDYERAMFSAVQFGHKETVRLLLLAGVKVNMQDENGITPLHYAAYLGEEHMVTYLLAAGAKVNAGAERGATPLHMAADAGHFVTMKHLLQSSKVDVNATNDDGDTPLHDAARLNRSRCIPVLIAAGNRSN